MPSPASQITLTPQSPPRTQTSSSVLHLTSNPSPAQHHPQCLFDIKSLPNHSNPYLKLQIESCHLVSSSKGFPILLYSFFRFEIGVPVSLAGFGCLTDGLPDPGAALGHIHTPKATPSSQILFLSPKLNSTAWSRSPDGFLILLCC
jgi:hypothetical protein